MLNKKYKINQKEFCFLLTTISCCEIILLGKNLISKVFILIIILIQPFLFNTNTPVNSELEKLTTGVDLNRTTRFDITDSMSIDSIFDEGLLSKNSENKSWTYMLYLDADNDIEADAIRDFEWLEEAGGSDENISIVVLLDRIPGYDNTHGNWNGSRIYNITDDISATTIDSQLMVDLGEVDMANLTTLTNFINYSFTNFPAENYILDLWNHGHAAYGVIDDETSMSHFIANDVQNAIANALASSSEEIDIISMDACNMITAEVAWELRNLCKYFIASEDGTNGYPYRLIIEGLKSDPSINASSLCELMVDAYSDHYQYTYMTCLSVINQTQFIDIPEIINSFITELIAALEGNNIDDIFSFCREITYDFYDDFWIDFISFVDNIISFLDYPSLNLAAEELLEFLGEAVVFNWQHPGYLGSANGLTLYMPFDVTSEEFFTDYTNRLSFCTGMDWQVDTLWDEFLTYYYENSLTTSNMEPLMLSLEDIKEDCSIQQNSVQIYRINIWEKSFYEFYCSITMGEVDIKVFEFDMYGVHEFIGGSYLINPEDATAECCRFLLETGFYLIMVSSKALTSNFDLVVKEYDAINLLCNSPFTSSGGSINGDEQEHFKQYLNHYFQIDIPYGNNTISLTNTESANYQLTIYDEDWRILFFMPAEGFGEILSMIYNHTSTSSITFILEICGYEGVGDFTIEINNPNEPTPKMTFNIWQLVFFFPIIIFVSKKRKMKSNS